jgi:hypothetical protein
MTVGIEYKPSTTQGLPNVMLGDNVVDISGCRDVLSLDVLETVPFFDTTAALTIERKRNTINMVKIIVSTSTESKMWEGGTSKYFTVCGRGLETPQFQHAGYLFSKLEFALPEAGIQS